MTRDEQIRMLLHPEEYSDEQLAQMLDETDITEPNASEAWDRFRSEKRKVKSEKFSLMKIAAMFIGVLMLSGISYAAYRMATSFGADNKSTIQETQVIHARQQVETQVAATDSTQQKPMVYEDVELATILKDVATFYEVELVYKTEACKHIRLYFTWDRKSTIDDIIDTFNKFERIHITRENKKLIVE